MTHLVRCNKVNDWDKRPPSHSQGARNSGGRGNSRGNGFQRGNKRGGIRQKDTKRYPKCRGKFSVTSDTTENDCTQSKITTTNVNRGQRNVDKKSHCTSKTMQGSIPKQLVLSTPKRWRSKTSVKLKTIKPTCNVPTFQYRRLVNNHRPAKSGRLHAKNRLKGDIFSFVHQLKTKKISEVQMGRNPVRIHSPTLRVSRGSKAVHQNNETSSRYIAWMGVRMIIYLDDILLMAENPPKMQIHRNSTLFLLQKLGFLIDWKKSSLNPTQKIEFLGFQINLVGVMFYLPTEKVSQIKTKCTEMLSAEIVTVRQLAMLTGKLSSSMQALFPSNLQSRFLQMDQIKGHLKGKSYEQEIILSQTARDELIWWVTKIEEFNGKAIITPCPGIVITSDASNLGWGLFFKTKVQVAYGGKQESKFHINAKELLAAFLVVQTFAKE
ncbi:unnamed protein product [Mytilus coruscus]|uniref:Reverse transcriptase domain-containing protein n=1 Tax=Mytilus coruscus TaxID=42192 RepID=A0A6J8DAX3_MYTCO|nr:unnamed protein product [Mytilus coruscus]